MIYSFSDFELDTQLYELRRSGQTCPIEPQVFDALAYLIEHRDRVISKQELLDYLCPERPARDATLSRCIMLARKATGDNADKQRIIQTRYRRGYRFVARLSELPQVSANEQISEQ